MNNKRAFILWVSASILAGCASSPSSHTSVFSLGSVVARKADMAPTTDRPVVDFQRDEEVFFYSRLSWPSAALPPGYRLIEWRWMKGDQVVATTSARYLFKSAPHDIRTRMPASTLGDGVFTVAVHLEGHLLDQRSFTVGGAGQAGR